MEDAQSLTLIRLDLSSAVWYFCGRGYSHSAWHWGHTVDRNPLSWFLIEYVSSTNKRKLVALYRWTQSYNVTLIIHLSEQRQTISFSISTRFLLVSVFLSLSASPRLRHWSELLKAKGRVISVTKQSKYAFLKSTFAWIWGLTSKQWFINLAWINWGSY